MSAQLTTEPDEEPPRRMRLGTKSCAECRRRKVRCCFPESGSVCERCALYRVPCRPQQLKRRERCRNPADDNTEEKKALQRRLAELEEVVRQIRRTKDLDSDPSTIEPSESGIAEAITRLQVSSDPESSSNSLIHGYSALVTPAGSSTLVSTIESADGSDNVLSSINAPLISLFKDTMSLCNEIGQDCHAKPTQSSISTKKQVSALMYEVIPFLPCRTDLHTIFETTNKLWLAAPICYFGDDPIDTLQMAGVPGALDFVLGAIPSGNPATIAKALGWLAFCLLQFPYVLVKDQVNLPATPRILIDFYLQVSVTLLSIAINVKESIDNVECGLLQCKVYLDIGRPRKAFQCIRQAVNSALLLGLYQTKKILSDDRTKYLWTAAWQTERQLCCLLGMPSSLADSHTGILNDSVGLAPLPRLSHELNRLLGAIIERDQLLRSTDDYSVTVQIDQDWERLRLVTPPDFWNSNPSQGLAPSEIFLHQMLRMHYFIVGKSIHMPYVSKASKEPKYEHSRTACLSASRSIINTYRVTRHWWKATKNVHICETMDFQAFSAACCLAVTSLTGQRRTEDGATEQSDWALIDGLAADLKETARIVDCSVAAQGSELLELFSMINCGIYEGPKLRDVAIPYFGRVRISCDKDRPCKSMQPAVRFPIARPAETVDQLSFPMVEYSNFVFPCDLGSETELQANWVSDWTDLHMQNYDWGDVFMDTFQ
ncbi:hypothetical protein BX600DRAFT_439455 [Xylariales sp. PMI_506]|nr:hypothetical protein BX600DRAFT_439455 [Xylariales sp. PMI_506]